MKPAALVLALFPATLCCLAAERVSVTPAEGAGHWKLTLSDSLPLQAFRSITVPGDIKVRGKRGREIRYTVTQEVVAQDEHRVRLLTPLLRPRTAGGQISFLQPGAVSLEIPLATPSLTLNSQTGQIDAADIQGSLRVEAGAGRVVLDRIGGDVDVTSSGGTVLLGSIGGRVQCSSGGGSIRAVKVGGGASFETNGGDIELGEVLGPVRARTAAGGIHIDRAGAMVYAQTLGGPIVILHAGGSVTANSGGGPMEIADASSVQCRNAGGSIRLTNVGGSLQAVTQRGSIVVTVGSGRGMKESFLATGGGDITVFLPSNTGVMVEAEVSASRWRESIGSDFAGLQAGARWATMTVNGPVQGGGPLLRLHSTGGRIQIRQK